MKDKFSVFTVSFTDTWKLGCVLQAVFYEGMRNLISFCFLETYFNARHKCMPSKSYLYTVLMRCMLMSVDIKRLLCLSLFTSQQGRKPQWISSVSRLPAASHSHPHTLTHSFSLPLYLFFPPLYSPTEQQSFLNISLRLKSLQSSFSLDSSLWRIVMVKFRKGQ